MPTRPTRPVPLSDRRSGADRRQFDRRNNPDASPGELHMRVVYTEHTGRLHELSDHLSRASALLNARSAHLHTLTFSSGTGHANHARLVPDHMLSAALDDALVSVTQYPYAWSWEPVADPKTGVLVFRWVNRSSGEMVHVSQAGLHSPSDQPSVVTATGMRVWFTNGVPHRRRSPAFTSMDGTRAWYRNGTPVAARFASGMVVDGNGSTFGRGRRVIAGVRFPDRG